MYSPAKGHLGCFQVFVCYELAAIKQYVQVFKFFFIIILIERQSKGVRQRERENLNQAPYPGAQCWA